MKVTEVDGKMEDRILIAMIMDSKVLGAICSKQLHEPFRSRYSNQIHKWCVLYYSKYGRAPKKAIEAIFQRWAGSKQRNESDVALIEKLLSGLSKQYTQEEKKINSDFILDEAESHFNEILAEKTIQDAQADLDMGKPKEALERLSQASRIEIGLGAGVDFLTDREKVISTMNPENKETLVKYPSGIGKFFGDTLAKGKFISFLGPEKSGKTFWLQDVAFEALKRRRKVAFFSVGDMTEEEIGERILERVSEHPSFSVNGKWPCTLKFPIKIRLEDKQSVVQYEDRVFEEPLDGATAWEKCQEFMKDSVRSDESYFRLSCHPNCSINARGIEDILKTWAAKDFLADVVIIDYADLLIAPKEGSNYDKRDQIDVTWRQLRGLSQKFHNLVVTATQTKAAGYTAGVLTREHFSDDKRKLAHVSGMIGINVSEEEKSEQKCRLNWIVRRRGPSPYRCCYVAGCLGISNPNMVSIF